MLLLLDESGDASAGANHCPSRSLFRRKISGITTKITIATEREAINKIAPVIFCLAIKTQALSFPQEGTRTVR
jgi:hypothetical protein